MASRVHFRFSSSTDFDFVSFDGAFITIGELKFLIAKKTGVLKDRSTVIELFDIRTGEEYVNANTMVAKNASVVAKRSPAVRPPPISAGVKTPPPPEEPKSDPKVEEDDGLGPGVFAPEARQEEDDAAISEFVKGFREVWITTDLSLQRGLRRGRGSESGMRGRRGPMKMPRSNLPPLGYICHRCNTPGHFIDECPTNGDPAYDFIRVRYPTGIPASMLEQDDQGGLLMPNGERARLKPNTEKFFEEMRGVPGGEPSVKQLTAPPMEGDALTDQKFEELSNLLAGNPLACLTPLVMHVLPRARDLDIRRGFFGGEPFDRQTFKECREEHDRAKAAFEGSTTPAPPTWTQPPPPSHPPSYESGQWRRPPAPEFYGDEQWSQKAAYPEFGPPRTKPVYVDHPPPWDSQVQAPFYDPRVPQAPPYVERYRPEPPMPYPPPPVENAPLLHSEVVRLHPHPPEEHQRHLAADNDRRSEERHRETSQELPYGFERSAQKPSVEETAERDRRRPRSRSRSLERSHRRKSELREVSRTPSIKKSKIHKRSKDKSHHRRRLKERHSSKKKAHDRSPSPQARRHYSDQEGGLDRWELEEPDDDYTEHDTSRHRRSERRSARGHSEKGRRSRRQSDL